MWLDAMIFFFFFDAELQTSFFIFYLTLIKRFFSSSSLSAIKVVSSTYLRLIFLPAILTPACDSSSLAFHTDVLCI